MSLHQHIHMSPASLATEAWSDAAEGASKIQGLNFLWLEITGKCNLTCKHCYAESSPQGSLQGDMELDDWLRVIDEAAEIGCHRVQFIGGEPTLHPYLARLIEHANLKGFGFIEVFTNATHLGNALIGCFQRNKVHVATSFYSDDPLTHDRITQTKGSWRLTVKGIQDILAADLRLRVGVIEMEHNAGHIPRTVDFLNGLGVENVGVDYLRGVGRSDRFNIKQAEERYDQLCWQCWKQRLCVTATGDVFPCVFSRATDLGNAKDGLVPILESMKLLHFRQKVRALEAKRRASSEVTTQCYPDQPCNPQGPFCSPDVPCSPQGPFCTPDRRCQPMDVHQEFNSYGK